MTGTAILFPGQGSQTPEMRDLVASTRPDLLQAAIEAVGEDPFLRVDDGTMLALLGAGAAEHATALADANGVAVANDNSPQQVVLSGERAQLQGAATAAEPFADVRTQLAQALTMPVRWREVLLTLQANGVDRYLEVGPGNLTGLVKRTLKDVELVSA
jgi:[acyl-carrier-protein] S-malonyltransferase